MEKRCSNDKFQNKRGDENLVNTFGNYIQNKVGCIRFFANLIFSVSVSVSSGYIVDPTKCNVGPQTYIFCVYFLSLSLIRKDNVLSIKYTCMLFFPSPLQST